MSGKAEDLDYINQFINALDQILVEDLEWEGMDGEENAEEAPALVPDDDDHSSPPLDFPPPPNPSIPLSDEAVLHQLRELQRLAEALDGSHSSTGSHEDQQSESSPRQTPSRNAIPDSDNCAERHPPPAFVSSPIHYPSPPHSPAFIQSPVHLPSPPAALSSNPCALDDMTGSGVQTRSMKRAENSEGDAVPVRGRKRQRSVSPQVHGDPQDSPRRRRLRDQSHSPPARQREIRRQRPASPIHRPSPPRVLVSPDPFIMEDMGFTINQRYRVEERRFRLKFKPEYHKKRLKDLDTELHDMFQRVLDRSRREYNDRDRIRLYIDHDSLHRPLVMHLRPIQHMNPEAITSRIQKVLNSDEGIAVDHSFTVSVGIQKREGGVGTGDRGYFTNLDPDDPLNSLFQRKCVIKMNNKDNLCLARSLVICKAKSESDPSYGNLINSRYIDSKGANGLLGRALDLHMSMGLPTDVPLDIREYAPRFEEHMDCQIFIFDGRHNNCIFYVGNVEKPRKYYLMKVDDHVVPLSK